MEKYHPQQPLKSVPNQSTTLQTQNSQNSHHTSQNSFKQSLHNTEVPSDEQPNQQFIPIQKQPSTFAFDFKSIAQIYQSLSTTNPQTKRKFTKAQNKKSKPQIQKINFHLPNASHQNKRKTKNQSKLIKSEQKAELKLFSTLSNNVISQIKHLTSQYQAQLCQSYTTKNVMSNFKIKNKTQLFKLIIFSFIELKNKDFQDFPEQQRNKYDLNIKEPNSYLKGIVFDIDQAMSKYKNNHSILQISKHLQHQWEVLLKNMTELNNYDLRKKIVTRFFTAKEIATMDEIQFYTQQKKTQILAKKRQFVHNSTVGQIEPAKYQQYDQYGDTYDQYFSQNSQKNYKEIKILSTENKMKNLVKDILLMGIQIPKKMKERIASQLVDMKDICKHLIQQCDEVFFNPNNFDAKSYFKQSAKYSFVMDWRYIQIKQDNNLVCEKKKSVKKCKTPNKRRSINTDLTGDQVKKSKFKDNQWRDMEQVLPKCQQFDNDQSVLENSCQKDDVQIIERIQRKQKHSIKMKAAYFKVQQDDQETQCGAFNLLKSQNCYENLSSYNGNNEIQLKNVNNFNGLVIAQQDSQQS